MYSVVMMMALTAGTETPDFGHRRGGCSGCAGYGGCAAVSYCGCSGGGRRGHGHRGHGCAGYGGCYGGGYAYGCHGGGYGYGCYGGAVSYGCYGGGYGGGYGCGGGIYGGGCYGMPVMPGAGSGGTGGKLPPPKKGKGAEGGSKPAPEGTDEIVAPTTGTILVNLPSDARLTVDGAPTTSTSDSRVLVREDLQPGYEYYYTLRAEAVVGGQTVTQMQRVAVRPGEQTRVAFDFSSSGVASSR
jgi:uncharacterized protein (TIGR03000 family)